eukprot:TRINITY_DN7746_c0_g1_i1.p1 TRINITY_DN7746_c0_g1~~TRINITY_DN7746_c0_g1_i1.p1  ORF type:complete len:125 (-),score=38.18 TRINITY_DN7746_c0_g1_i1:531-905(-)
MSPTSSVMQRFTVTSMAMWASPLAILWAFHADWIPAVSDLSPENRTLLSGILAVVSVNVVIGIYIYLALKDPPNSATPQPDPRFVAAAQRSVDKLHGQEEDEEGEEEEGEEEDEADPQQAKKER